MASKKTVANIPGSPLLEYGVAKAVLQALPNMQQLNNAAKVCRSWNEAARIIKRNRRQIYQVSNAVSYEDHENIEKIVKTIKSQPHLCIAFLTYEGMGEIPPPLPELSLGEEHTREHHGRFTEYHILHYLKQIMPSDCQFVGGVANGIIMSDSQVSSLPTTEIEDGDAHSLFFIPNIPGVTFTTFYLDKPKMKKFGSAIVSHSEPLLSRLLNMEDTKDIKCLILLGTDYSKESKAIETTCQHFQEKVNPNIAIGGGFVEAVIHPNVVDGDRECGFMGLVFGGADLLASSVVIPPDVTSVSDIEKIIIQMKQRHVPVGRRQSIAFMFACVARGVNLHGSTGVESSLFRKHFPSTPLLGFFGNGEIGVNSFSSHSQPPAPSPSQPSAPKKPRATYLHSYATNLVLLSFPQ